MPRKEKLPGHAAFCFDLKLKCDTIKKEHVLEKQSTK